MEIPKHILDRLPEQVRTDPKKSVALLVLVLILLITAGRFVSKTEPKSASAASASSGVNAENGVDAQIAAARSRASIQLTTSTDSGLRLVEAWLEEPAAELSRNIFAVRPDSYPRQAVIAAQIAVDVDRRDDSFWKQLEKSLANRADQMRQRREDQTRIVEGAGGLRLQSTVLGKDPTAIISGQVVRRGDRIRGRTNGANETGIVFTVVRLDARGVDLTAMVKGSTVTVELLLDEEKPRLKERSRGR